jgi:hypothetical protein
MTDWKTTCESFNQYTDNTAQYPNICTLASAKSEKEMKLFERVNRLKGKIDALGGEYTETNTSAQINNDRVVLKQAMSDFCCSMWARNEYKQRQKDAQEDYEVSKYRVESVRNPPAKLSYLGTVIPLPRPLRPDSVPILLIISLVFLIMALGMLLNLGNVQLAYVGPRSYGPGFLTQLMDSYQQTSWMVLLITVVVSAGSAFGVYYGIQKTHPEWLNK